MSYSLSFSEEFFTGGVDGIGECDLQDLFPVTRRPQSVMQALVSMEKLRPRQFREMVKETLGYNLTAGQPVKETLGYNLTAGQPVDESVFFDLLEKIREFDTCDTLTPPIAVSVSNQYAVLVYDDKEEEVA